MLALLDYPSSTGKHPEFTLALRVNFKSGVAQEQFGFRFVGSEGVMTTSMSGITLSKPPKEIEALGLRNSTSATSLPPTAWSNAASMSRCSFKPWIVKRT
jgi:hypothetical protein